MKIFIKTQTGEVITLEVDPKNIIKDVKKQIQDKKGFLPDHQRISYRGKRMEDHYELSDQGVQREVTLDLWVLREKQEVQIKTLTGETITLDDVYTSDTIDDVKHKIMPRFQLGFPDLYFNCEKVEDFKSVSYYSIQNESTVCFHLLDRGLIPYRLLTFYEHTPPIKVWNVHFVVTGFNNSDVEKAVFEMGKRSCTKGDQEIMFSFDSNGEIIFKTEAHTLNGWKITPFQALCKIYKRNVGPSCDAKISLRIEGPPDSNTFTHIIPVSGTRDPSLSVTINLEDSLNQVKFSTQKIYTINKGNEERRLFWEEHGIHLLIPQNAIPSSVTSCEIAVLPVLEGSFVFPNESTPVSAIYAIGSSCKLEKPVRIAVQHCVDITDPSHCDQLSFAKAEHVDKAHPYQFKEVAGGHFSVGSEYGSLDCSSFSFIAIIRKKIAYLRSRSATRYKLLSLYRHTHGTNVLLVYFVVTKNINSIIENAIAEMIQRYSDIKREEPEIFFSFNDDGKIVFTVQHEVNGWRLTSSQNPCQIFKEDVDNYYFHDGGLASVALRIEGSPVSNRFTHAIPISGTRDPTLSITINLEDSTFASPTTVTPTTPTVVCIEPPSLVSAPSFDELVNDVAAHALDQWKLIGINLKIKISKLNAIEAQNHGDPMKCFIAIIHEWENAATRPYTWETIVDVLESNSVMNMDLADNIRVKYLSPI